MEVGVPLEKEAGDDRFDEPHVEGRRGGNGPIADHGGGIPHEIGVGLGSKREAARAQDSGKAFGPGGKALDHDPRKLRGAHRHELLHAALNGAELGEAVEELEAVARVGEGLGERLLELENLADLREEGLEDVELRSHRREGDDIVVEVGLRFLGGHCLDLGAGAVYHDSLELSDLAGYVQSGHIPGMYSIDAKPCNAETMPIYRFQTGNLSDSDSKCFIFGSKFFELGLKTLSAQSRFFQNADAF